MSFRNGSGNKPMNNFLETIKAIRYNGTKK
jgi:hypothetical protein